MRNFFENLLPEGQVRAQIDQQDKPTDAERSVLERMTQVFQAYQGHVMSMLGVA